MYEGLETHEAEARLVERNVRLRSLEQPMAPRWAKLSDLEALGFKILSRMPDLRSVHKGAETFVEGHLQSEIVEAQDELAEPVGRGRPSGMRRQARLNEELLPTRTMSNLNPGAGRLWMRDSPCYHQL